MRQSTPTSAGRASPENMKIPSISYTYSVFVPCKAHKRLCLIMWSGKHDLY